LAVPQSGAAFHELCAEVEAMTKGKPFEYTTDEVPKPVDAAALGPVMHAPDPKRHEDIADPAGYLAQSIATAQSGTYDDSDTLDADVQHLLNALATEEVMRDEAWLSASEDESAESSDDAILDDIAEMPVEIAAMPEDLTAVSETPTAMPEEVGEFPEELTALTDDAEGEAVMPLSDMDSDVSLPDEDSMPLLQDDHDDGDDHDRYDDTERAEDDSVPDTVSDPVTGTLQESGDLIDDAPHDTSAADGIERDDDGHGVDDVDDVDDYEDVIDPAPAMAQPESGQAADTEAQATNLLGLQAINAIGEKIAASESRYDDALTKMGHALGMIAQRIDGLETRLTNQTIANVALAAAPPEEEDDSVAPYIARAERELKTRKESGSMDIFDRIARAAETEFDDQATTGGTRVLENSSDGRRVGTKRWQPSKTFKQRMEKLEEARKETQAPATAATGPRAAAAAAFAEPKQPAARKLRTEADLDPEIENDALLDHTDDHAGGERALAPEPILDLEEEDDSGLSVVPGARGRRRNRARKSRLDEDFENVFVEDEDEPSISNLRRKMRDRPADETDTEVSEKGGMLSGILGKKSAKKARPAPAEQAEEEEDDLMAAFDTEADAPRTVSKSSKKRKAVVIDDDDDFDDDDEEWDDEDGARGGANRRPILYVLIAAAAAAGFYAWKTFIG